MKKKIRVTASLFILLLLAACSTKEVEKTNETADEAPVNAAELVESPILPENCSHPSWTNEHICTVCGYACGHEVWINGVCALCGAVCEHPAHDAETQLCTICGAKTWHSFYHGLCACGAKPDLRENYLEPAEYFVDQEQQGTIEYVPYRAGNYFYEDGPDYFDKELIVYLPYDYDDTNQYDVVLFIHGTGGTPNDFMTREIDYYGPHPKVRGVDLYDYIFANKLAKPMILVSISAKAILGGSHATEMSTKQIGQEIRDDILPCIVEHFSTYAADSSAESIRDAANIFAFAEFPLARYLPLTAALYKITIYSEIIFVFPAMAGQTKQLWP